MNYRGEIMELGEKLRQVRLAAGLSQRQLCGDVITRNMLSQIENGTARPSMDTLRYLAGVLGKPMGYFLEEDPAQEMKNPMETAREAYRNGEYESAISILSQIPSDDEKGLLELLSLLALAERAIRENRRPYARQLLESATRAEERTMYASDALRQKRLVLLSKTEPESVVALVEQLPTSDEALLLRARGALQQGNLESCGNYLNACENRETAEWQLLAGENCMKSEDFAHAVVHYQGAEREYPEECFRALERCFLEMENYKQAYEYACKQRKEDTLC